MAERPKLILLEHDDRFEVFPEFTWYDFQQPFKLPGEDTPSDIPRLDETDQRAVRCL